MNNSAFMENLKQLFAECDTNNNGSLGRQEFRQLCTKIGLDTEAANETFDRLDFDKDDRITFDEFTVGFNQYSKQSSQPKQQQQQQHQSMTSPSTLSSPIAQSTTTTTTAKPNQSSKGSISPSSSPSTGNHLRAASNKSSDSSTTSKSLRSSSATSGTSKSNQKLSPASPVSIVGARKNASPLGVMSLGGGGGGSNSSSHNNLLLTTSGAQRSNSAGGYTADMSSADFNSADEFAVSVDLSTGNGGSNSLKNDPTVIYSSDNIIGSGGGGGCLDYDQTNNSGQFASMLSSNGSFNQLRTMQDLLECVQKLQSENQILTKIFFKDKREREEYISQLGEEFDLQVREVEERANRRAREELESEKKRLRDMMTAERETLQHHYETIEKMSHLIKSSNNGKLGLEESESIDRVKSRLEDTYLENRQLKKSLLDTKTDVAMIWKEMEKLKCQYEDKLTNAYQRNNETRSECDHIKQQLTLMKDSNRKLQDASDVITNYITDKVDPVIKGSSNMGLDDGDMFLGPSGSNSLTGSNRLGVNSQTNSRRGSILSQYLNGANSGSGNEQPNSIDGYGNNSSINSGDIESLGSSNRGRILTQIKDVDDIANSSATGSVVGQNRPIDGKLSKAILSSVGEKNDSIKKSSSYNQQQQLLNTFDSISEDPNSFESPSQVKVQERKLRNRSERDQQSTSLIELSKSNEPTKGKSINKRSLLGGRFFIGGSRDIQTYRKNESTGSKADLTTKSLSLDHMVDEPTVEPADGPSKATFDIILVGDSFVGKSSFASRFVEGTFVQGLLSNCSIDFKTKALKIDGSNYTVNLWDTAGQERFRSITASYFRKANGIILMYDVTDKSSYLNVRNWMSTISDTASENVAVLLVGNKIDLRLRENVENCVPTREGARLANEYGIVFLETSVKTGINLMPSMGKLIRLIARNNMPKEEDEGRIKLNDKSKTFNCMPKNC